MAGINHPWDVMLQSDTRRAFRCALAAMLDVHTRSSGTIPCNLETGLTLERDGGQESKQAWWFTAWGLECSFRARWTRTDKINEEKGFPHMCKQFSGAEQPGAKWTVCSVCEAWTNAFHIKSGPWRPRQCVCAHHVYVCEIWGRESIVLYCYRLYVWTHTCVSRHFSCKLRHPPYY